MLEMPDRSRLKVDAQSYKYTWQAMHTGHQRPPIGRFAAQESFGHRHRPAALQCGERSVRIGQKQSRNYFPRSGAHCISTEIVEQARARRCSARSNRTVASLIVTERPATTSAPNGLTHGRLWCETAVATDRAEGTLELWFRSTIIIVIQTGKKKLKYINRTVQTKGK